MMNESRVKQKTNLLSRPPFFMVSIIIVIIFLGLTSYVFTTPTMFEETVTTQTLKQDVTFGTMVIPKVSTLYPTPQQLKDEKIYFTQSTESFKVLINVEVNTDPETNITGTSKVILKLRAGELWERDFPLGPQKAFEGEGKVVVLNGYYDIPLQHILAFTKQVEEETMVRPRGYDLQVIPLIKAETRGAEGLLTNEFSPAYLINFSTQQITPQEEAKQEQTTSLTETVVAPVNFKLLQAEISIVVVRYVMGILTLLFFGLSIWLFRLKKLDREPFSEVQHINRRYRGRIVTARSESISPDATIIRLATFKELLKLAEERDKSIICVKDKEDDRRICRYCIPDVGILYCYVALDEPPGKNAWGQVTPGEGITS